MTRSSTQAERWLTIAAAVVLAAWVWRCVCVFPWLLWNELRLEPTFVLANGLPLYPATGEAPVTTWMYGPLTPLLFLPTVLASSTAAALLGAAAINLVIAGGTIAVACAAWPAAVTGRDRLVAALFCLAAWPASSLQYIQADNAAVALGTVASVLLLRSTVVTPGRRWLAAAAAAASILCKQTAVAPLLAQVVWLGWTEGGRAAAHQFVRAAAAAVLFAGFTVRAFGGEGVWLNLIAVPDGLPWAADVAQRVRELAPWLAIHLLLPAIAIAAAGKVALAKSSPLSLATLCWLASLPFGLAAVFKTGGTINSLHGLLFFMPAAIVTWLQAATDTADRRRTALVIVALGIAVVRLSISPTPAWKPVTAHLRQADAIARQLPGEVWFPWNPLVTYFSEGRLDHAEDGLYVRQLTGHPVAPRTLRAGLPPHWSVVALLTNSAHWGYALELAPAQAQATGFGNWTLHSWPAIAGTSRDRGAAATPPAGL